MNVICLFTYLFIFVNLDLILPSALYSRCQQMFILKSQLVNILAFKAHAVMQMKWCDCTLIKLFANTGVGQNWPGDSLPDP